MKNQIDLQLLQRSAVLQHLSLLLTLLGQEPPTRNFLLLKQFSNKLLLETGKIDCIVNLNNKSLAM